MEKKMFLSFLAGLTFTLTISCSGGSGIFSHNNVMEESLQASINDMQTKIDELETRVSSLEEGSNLDLIQGELDELEMRVDFLEMLRH